MEILCTEHNIDNCQECLELENLREAEIDVQPEENNEEHPNNNIKTSGKKTEHDLETEENETKNGDELELEETEENKLKIEFGLDKSHARDVTSVQAKLIKNLTIIETDKGSENDDAPHKFSLFEVSEQIPRTSFDNFNNPDVNLDQQIKDIERKRILLLGDSEDNYGYRFSCQIARLLGITNQPKNIRILNVSKYSSIPLTVDFLSLERKSEKNQNIHDALIIINTKSKGGTTFSDSLLNPENSLIDHFPSMLKINNFYIVCLMKPETIYQWKRNNSRLFPDWIIPPIKKGKPINEDVSVIQSDIEELLMSEGEAEKSIVRIILFIVSFFPNLTTDDFNDLVQRWLKIEPKVVFEKTSEKDSKQIVPTEISLPEVWKSKSNSLTADCFLTQNKDEQGKRIISFKNKLYLEQIKESLEQNHWAFIDEKVSQILDLRLIFNLSDNIATRSGEIIAEYLPDKEEKFIDWVLWIIENPGNAKTHDEHLKKRKLRIPGSDSPEDTKKTGKTYFYYERLTKLFRTILADSSLKHIVSSIIEKSIQNKFYQPALAIVKDLKFAPNFDETFWLKQLIIRGENKTRDEIRKYLFNNLKKFGMDEVYEKLKDWLPKEDSENHSQVNQMALYLLIDYYSYLTYKFDERSYGTEPSLFPLFQFKDIESAHKNLELLAKYLLHSINLNSEIEDSPYIFYVAFLIEKWSNILCKDNLLTPHIMNNKNAGNREKLEILLEKIIIFSQEKDQRKILDVWRELKVFYAYIAKYSNDWKIREEHERKYEFVANLIEIFMNKQWSAD